MKINLKKKGENGFSFDYYLVCVFFRVFRSGILKIVSIGYAVYKNCTHRYNRGERSQTFFLRETEHSY